MKPPKPESETEVEKLRRLAEERRAAERAAAAQRKHEGDALEQRWAKKRGDYAQVIVAPMQQELLRLCRKAAEDGQSSLVVDLGVDEGRLRQASPTAALSLADAVLAPKALEDPRWAYTGRVGWVIQMRDGRGLTPAGEELIARLRGLGFEVRFTPYHTQDSYAEPFCNAKLHLSW